MTRCADEPAVPERPTASEPRTDKAKADYLKSLRSAYLDCKAVPAGVKDRKARYAKQVEQTNYNWFERQWRAITGQTD